MQVQNVPFIKMNGCGNEILVVDMRGQQVSLTGEKLRGFASDGRLRFDQAMVLYEDRERGADSYLEIFNVDGSRAEACGNGMRCVASVLSAQMQKDSFALRTRSGLLHAWVLEDGEICVDMGIPRFGWEEIPLAEEFYDTRQIELQLGPIDQPELHSPSVVNMGNPHAIFWVEKDVDAYDLAKIGSLLEYHPLFPEGVNLSLARVRAVDALDLRVWERGAGLTQACGSAACAATVAAVRLEKTEPTVRVSMPGGVLQVFWKDQNHVYLTGSVRYEFSGVLDLETGHWTRRLEE